MRKYLMISLNKEDIGSSLNADIIGWDSYDGYN